MKFFLLIYDKSIDIIKIFLTLFDIATQKITKIAYEIKKINIFSAYIVSL